MDLLLISSVLENRNDNKLRKQLISSGIVERLLFIFSNRDLNSITREFSQIFFNVTSNSSNEVKLLIYYKNPYPGLIRLLEHPDNLIVGDAIASILFIIQAGSITTPDNDPHPHYNSILACDGINQIFALFQKNLSKYSRDRASICLGFLFKSRKITDTVMILDIINHLKILLNDSDDFVKERAQKAIKYLAQNEQNRIYIINSEELKRIEQNLKQPIQGTEEQQKYILLKQETDLLLISSVLEDRNDDELRKGIISSGIVENLLFIFSNRDLNSVTQAYSQAFIGVINNSSDEIKLLIFNTNPYPGLIHLLEHADNLIVGDAIASILFLLGTGTITTPFNDPHPHFEIIQVCDGVMKIFELFQKNVNKYNRDRAAICIGFLFKAHLIADPVMRQKIINHLKSLLNDSDNLVKEVAKTTITFLAQNDANRSEILNEEDLKQIDQDLIQPIEGTDEQQKSILHKQEMDLILISAILEGSDDNELRKRIISSGIVENLLFIFSNRDLNSITREFSQIFFNVTSNSNNEVKLLIYYKNPYPGLIRLLEHPDNLIVGDAIASILFIIQAGSITTPDNDPHPHYEQILACDGLNQIFTLFQKNLSKYSRDRASICLGFLFKSRKITDTVMKLDIINHLKILLNDSDDLVKERAQKAIKYLAQNESNRSEILNIDILKVIIKSFQKEFKGTQDEKEEIIKLQESDCLFLYSILHRREDIQSRIDAINSGIIDILLHIFASRDLDDITRPYTNLFFVFTHPPNFIICQLLIQKQPFLSLLRLLDHKDENIVSDAIASIGSILHYSAVGTEMDSQHPFFEDLASAGGIEKLFSLFKSTTSIYSKNVSAICLGIVFRAQEIKDSIMRKEVITLLKSIINDVDQQIQKLVKCALKCLAQNEVNKAEIVSDDFIIPE
ncbi:MAG: hypothetical protein EZS28_025088 [Streblomastix strix]|uniref:Uncharacterized protein n=1 Tax=Streblomastix strix TaxID=222440 RepID=A0A5J4VA29_9EUKA|nr:MAG: hypothetical protein EZS28_025088 [Streblomastix strix]